VSAGDLDLGLNGHYVVEPGCHSAFDVYPVTSTNEAEQVDRTKRHPDDCTTWLGVESKRYSHLDGN
jgi:hypothetical protein